MTCIHKINENLTNINTHNKTTNKKYNMQLLETRSDRVTPENSPEANYEEGAL